MSGLGGKTLEIPEIVVRTLCLGNFGGGFRFSSVDNVWEFNSILDEEDGNVVADEIPVTLAGVKLGSKPTNIANSISGSTKSEDGGESNKQWSLIASVVEDGCARKLRNGFVETKHAMRTGATSMHNTLRNPLVIEMMDLSQTDLS
jgi:hypothetical protein